MWKFVCNSTRSRPWELMPHLSDKPWPTFSITALHRCALIRPPIICSSIPGCDQHPANSGLDKGTVMSTHMQCLVLWPDSGHWDEWTVIQWQLYWVSILILRMRNLLFRGKYKVYRYTRGEFFYGLMGENLEQLWFSWYLAHVSNIDRGLWEIIFHHEFLPSWCIYNEIFMSNLKKVFSWKNALFIFPHFHIRDAAGYWV